MRSTLDNETLKAPLLFSIYLSLICRNQSRSELMRTCSSCTVWHVRRFFLRHAKMKRQEPETTHWSRTSLNLSDDDGSVSSGRIDCHVVDVDSCFESLGSLVPSSSWRGRSIKLIYEQHTIFGTKKNSRSDGKQELQIINTHLHNVRVIH